MHNLTITKSSKQRRNTTECKKDKKNFFKNYMQLYTKVKNSLQCLFDQIKKNSLQLQSSKLNK
jgi:hypothetical protein